jgi:signal transduction histidine kinase
VAKEGINKELIIIIKDTGIGMSKDFIPKLYETFTQEKEGRTRDYDGTGLGMFVVKGLCDSIKAEISVKSKKGIGTTFILKIPNLKFI